MAWKPSALCRLGSQTFAGRDVQTGYEQGTGGFIAQSGFEETVQDVQPFREGCPFSRHLVLQCGILPCGRLWQDTQEQAYSKVGSRGQGHLQRVCLIPVLQGESGTEH